MGEFVSPGEGIARGLGLRGLSFHRLILILVGYAIAIGDSNNPVLPAAPGIALRVLVFPMFDIEALTGNPLQRLLWDNHSLDICMGINAVVWSSVSHWLLPSVVNYAIGYIEVYAELQWPGRGILEIVGRALE